MKKLNFRSLIVLALLIGFAFTSCDVFDIQDQPDPNNSELTGVIENPSRADIITLATGTEASLRTDLRIYHINLGMVGREMYRFLQAEPRNTQDLLGKAGSLLDAGAFYTSRPWAAFYASIRNANILIQAAGTLQGGALSEAEAQAVIGFANTIKAYEYLMASNMQNENGIRRQDPMDPQATGELLAGRQASLDFIISLLDEGAGNLSNGGDSFPFTLSSGFEDFNTPATFLQFNRALRARVAAYNGNYEEVSGFLGESFIDASEDLENGAYHIYSTDPNDETNPVFADPQSGTGDSWIVHPSFIDDAEEGDNRVVGNKAIFRVDDGDPNPATFDGLTGSYGLFVYKSQTAPFPIIRNAELLLLRAEANINSSTPDLAAAIQDLNVIREEAGLDPYSGALTQEALNDEMLRQRRYELFFEGHRWVDMRRFDRLDELPLDRPDDDVWESFPLPEAENIGS